MFKFLKLWVVCFCAYFLYFKLDGARFFVSNYLQILYLRKNVDLRVSKKNHLRGHPTSNTINPNPHSLGI
jgi:hypothetical protein